MMKGYKHVNKKPKLIPQIYYAVNPYNKQVFSGSDLLFSTAINLWLIYRFSGNLITDNLTSFYALFQHLNID
ncbi:hypothetical protein FOK39_11645 [Salmonella enterica]|nr:hypothetical protein [Salmonella enterica]